MTTPHLQSLSSQLSRYLPEGTARHCAQWLMDNRTQLKVARPRKTRLGDFRPAQRGHSHRISVNADLSPLQFLITFTHEIAHVVTWDRYGRKVAPHGQEWKTCYRRHLHELLALKVLDEQTSQTLYQHSLNPKASSSTDSNLKPLNGPSHNGLTVNDLKAGITFQIASGKTFQVVKKLRKYWLCEEPATGRHYRVPGSLPVTVQTPLAET